MVLPKDGAHLPAAPTSMSGVPLVIRTLTVGTTFDLDATTTTGVFVKLMTAAAGNIPAVPVIAVFDEAVHVDRLIDLLTKHRANVWGQR